MKPTHSQRMLNLALGMALAVGLVLSVYMIVAQTRPHSDVRGPGITAGT